MAAPKGSNTRPTSEAVREGIFNVLAHRFAHEPHRVLDIFAGSGALSFEALSRGAERALMIESDRAALACIQKNREHFGIGSDALKCLTSPRIQEWGDLISESKDFLPIDTLFCDPPYGKGLVERALKALAKSRVPLAPEALLICEISSRDANPQLPHWTLEDERRRGTTGLLFYRHSGW